jgi:hypothetical protein
MPTSHNPYAPHSKAPEAAVEVEKEAEAPESVEESTEPQGVPEGSAAEVLEWVGDDKDRAKEALEAEEAGQQRVGLSKKLKELAE